MFSMQYRIRRTGAGLGLAEKGEVVTVFESDTPESEDGAKEPKIEVGGPALLFDEWGRESGPD